MTNRNLMESTVTRNMMGRRKPAYSNVDGQAVATKVIQEPVAGVGTGINSTTTPETTDPREALLTENTITPKEEATIAEIPVTEDSRTQETVMTTRPMAVNAKKGMSEDTKNLLLFGGVIFIAIGSIWVITTYGNKLPIKG